MIVIAIALVALAEACAAEAFRYEVTLSKLLRDERGQLDISESGVSFRSSQRSTPIVLSFEDIKEADVSDPGVIRLEMYDTAKLGITRRTYKFRLHGMQHNEKLAAFLAGHLERPVIGSYSVPAAPLYQLPVYHRHVLGGCDGRLEIGSDAIRFVSEKAEDSRTWLYSELETVGTADPLNFRVSTPAETYVFELKRRMPDEVYRAIWRRIYDDATLEKRTHIDRAVGHDRSGVPRFGNYVQLRSAIANALRMRCVEL